MSAEASNLIFGVVINGKLYSNRIERPVEDIPNGIYSMDMEADDFMDTLTPADISDARKFFSKASKIEVFRGVSFKDGIIPENPIRFKKIPVKVEDAVFDDFEEIEVVSLKGYTYYLQSLSTDKMYALMELHEATQSGKKIDLNGIKGLTPEMRVVFTFHLLEKKREALEKMKKEMAKPVNYIKATMEEGGATVQNVKKVNRGYEIDWTCENYRLNTLVNNDFRVIESGFCTTGHDDTQSVQSVVKLLKTYHEDDPHSVHVFRGSYLNRPDYDYDDYDDDYDD